MTVYEGFMVSAGALVCVILAALWLWRAVVPRIQAPPTMKGGSRHRDATTHARSNLAAKDTATPLKAPKELGPPSAEPAISTKPETPRSDQTNVVDFENYRKSKQSEDKAALEG